jgi:hypothetical protein
MPKISGFPDAVIVVSIGGMDRSVMTEVAPGRWRVCGTGGLALGGTQIDRMARTVCRTGLAGLLSSPRDLTDFDAVVLRDHPSDEGEGNYSVRLHGRNGRRDRFVALYGDHGRARALADGLATCAGLHVQDDAPLSLADKMRAAVSQSTADAPAEAPAPAHPLARVTTEGLAFHIAFPAAPSRPLAGWTAAVAVCAGLAVLSMLGGSPGLTFLLAVAAMLAGAIRTMRRGERAATLSVTADGLRLEGARFGRRGLSFAAADILDVTVAGEAPATAEHLNADRVPAPLPPGCIGGAVLTALYRLIHALAPRGLIVITRAGRFALGGHLSVEELVWLRQIVRRAVTRQP